MSVISQTLIGEILFRKAKGTNFAIKFYRIQKSTMSNSIQLDSIEEAVLAIKNGEVIIVVDDEDRENEGDFVCAAEKVTPEIINFMATHGRGLICAPLIEDRCDQLGLQLMVGNNTAAFETPFTVSVDLIGHGCTTGISASDRAKTIRALIDDSIHPDELGKPGHIFPLKAKINSPSSEISIPAPYFGLPPFPLDCTDPLVSPLVISIP